MQRHGFRHRNGRPGADPDGTRIAGRPGVLEGEVVGVGPIPAAARAAPAPSVAGTIGRSAAVVVLALAVFLGLLVFCVIH